MLLLSLLLLLVVVVHVVVVIRYDIYYDRAIEKREKLSDAKRQRVIAHMMIVGIGISVISVAVFGSLLNEFYYYCFWRRGGAAADVQFSGFAHNPFPIRSVDDVSW